MGRSARQLLSFAVTANLISAFVFTTQIVQCLNFLKPKIPASSHLMNHITGFLMMWLNIIITLVMLTKEEQSQDCNEDIEVDIRIACHTANQSGPKYPLPSGKDTRL